jgi:hypothetical protein
MLKLVYKALFAINKLNFTAILHDAHVTKLNRNALLYRNYFFGNLSVFSGVLASVFFKNRNNKGLYLNALVPDQRHSNSQKHYAAGIAMRTSTMAPYWMIGHPFAISIASS